MSVLVGKKILVVDDEISIRDLIITELEDKGAECIEASNGNDAFELYKNNYFDVVISDIRMPDGDAFTFMNNIRKAKLPTRAIIFMSAFLDVPSKEIYDLGIETIISKPFKMRELIAIVSTSLARPRDCWRKHPRINALYDLTLNYNGQNEAINAKTFNISKGGMFIHLYNPLPKVSESVHFKLEYDTSHGKELIEGDLKVHWVRPKTKKHQLTGFGGEFVGIPMEKLNDFYSAITIKSA
jgi:CheY-like chemotaxis protein